jgi:hypothetical protein
VNQGLFEYEGEIAFIQFERSETIEMEWSTILGKADKIATMNG